MGKILTSAAAVDEKTIDISKVQIAKINTKKYIKEEDIFSKAIGKNTDSEKIKEVQTILANLSYYRGEIDGEYSKALIDAIYDFQFANKLITAPTNLGAGYFGVQTRAKLKKVYIAYQETEKERIAEEARLAEERAAEEARIALLKAEQEKQRLAEQKEVALFVQSFGTPKMNEIGVHVRYLQQALQTLGYFEGKDTAIFGPKTNSALISYQTDKGIDRGELGELGKATKEALFQDLLSLKEKQGNKLAMNN